MNAAFKDVDILNSRSPLHPVTVESAASILTFNPLCESKLREKLILKMSEQENTNVISVMRFHYASDGILIIKMVKSVALGCTCGKQ